MRVAVPNTCPSSADSLDHLIAVPGPGGFLDAALGFVLLAVDTRGVDPQQNIDAVASPLSDLRRGHSGVQPGRDRRVPQVVGRLASRDAASWPMKAATRAWWKILR